MKAFISCVFAAICIMSLRVVWSDVVYEFGCDGFEATPMQNFSKDRYSGLWYMHQLHDFPGSQNYDCYTLAVVSVPGTKNATSTENLTDLSNIKKLSFVGVLVFNVTGSGQYIYYGTTYPVTQLYYIISTDYTNYSIQWSCQDIGTESVPKSLCAVYVYSRDRTVSSQTQATIDAILAAHHIDTSRLRTVDNSINTCVNGLIPQLLAVVGSLVGSVLGLLG